jgi:hypothetical protein
MVEEPETELVIHSEESQTAFEGELALLQPPPIEKEKQEKRKKLRTIIFGLGLFMMVMIGGLAYLVGNGNDVTNKPKSEPSPTPAPIYIDATKEAELQRVEKIVDEVNPETLLILPPQVDMTIQF